MTQYHRQLLAALLLTAFSTLSAAAQDYRFSVPELEMHAIIQRDASVKLIYDITFQNMPGAHSIDIVDIGVPHAGYSLGNVKASIAGQNLSDVRHSEFVDPGFEVHLGSGTIPPSRPKNEIGRLQFVARRTSSIIWPALSSTTRILRAV